MSGAKPPQAVIRRLIGFLVVIPFACLLIVAYLAYQTSHTLAASVGWVARTLEVKRTLSQLLSRMIDVEASQRGYLLTQQQAHLEPYRVAVEQLPRIQKELRVLTADNPHAQTQLDKLERLIAAELKAVRARLAQIQGGDFSDAIKSFRAAAEGGGLEAIRSTVRRMQFEEDRLLALREETARTQSELDQSLSQTMVVTDGLLILLLLHMLLRFQKLQTLVTICAWTKAVRHDGRWMTFEEYLQVRFGINVSHGLSEAARVQLQREVEAQQSKNTP